VLFLLFVWPMVVSLLSVRDQRFTVVRTIMVFSDSARLTVVIASPGDVGSSKPNSIKYRVFFLSFFNYFFNVIVVEFKSLGYLKTS
jgi:hypothetical protein